MEEYVGCKIELPMILHVDNRGAVDLINSWSVGGRTRHVDVRYWYLRKLKEQGVIRVEWISTTQTTAIKKPWESGFYTAYRSICHRRQLKNREPQGKGVRT